MYACMHGDRPIVLALSLSPLHICPIHSFGCIEQLLRSRPSLSTLNLLGNHFPSPSYTRSSSSSSSPSRTFVKDLQQLICTAGQRDLTACGCSLTAQELVIASTISRSNDDGGVVTAAERKRRRESDTLCVAIDVKLNSTLRSLQIDCSRCKGLVAVLRELVTNKRVLRLKLFNLTHASLVDNDHSRMDDVTAVFEELLTKNTTLRTLQLHFLTHYDDDDGGKGGGGGGGGSMEQRILLAVLSGLHRNEGLTTLQLDHWAKDSAVLLALGSALKTAASLHRLGLFHCHDSHSSSSSWSKDDISKIASCLQHNTTLRVLSMTLSMEEPQRVSIVVGEGEKGQLTKDMQGLFASATCDRTLPLVVRTPGQDEDRVFGAIHSLSGSTARLWEPEDEVELLDEDRIAGVDGSSGADDGRWVLGTVISVSSDHRYSIIQTTRSGAVTHSCSSKTLRPREGFPRRFCIPPPVLVAPLHRSVPTSFHAIPVDEGQEEEVVVEPLQRYGGGSSSSSRSDAVVPFSMGQKVELRYYGGVKWHPATILDVLAVSVPSEVSSSSSSAMTRPADAAASSAVSNTEMALITLSAGADHQELAISPSGALSSSSSSSS